MRSNQNYNDKKKNESTMNNIKNQLLNVQKDIINNVDNRFENYLLRKITLCCAKLCVI